MYETRRHSPPRLKAQSSRLSALGSGGQPTLDFGVAWSQIRVGKATIKNSCKKNKMRLDFLK